jgi:HEAT repeat protein
MRERFPVKAALGAVSILLAWGTGTSKAAASLAEAMEQLRSPDILISDAAVEDIVRAGPVAVDSLLAVLGDSRRDVRAGAIRGLGLLGDPRAVPPILGLLENSLDHRKVDTFEDRYLRILSIQSLGRLRAKEAVQILERASKGDVFEEAQSAVALFHLQESLGYSLVEKCLSDTTLAIRNLVVEGISEENSPEAKKILIEATKDPSWVVRDTAYRGLGNWERDSEVAEALVAGESDSSWFVRETVKQARGRTSPE